eukprot:10596658-Alexandrium_andersonii.AAC.1
MDSEGLFRSAFEAASRVGQVPYIMCGDVNVDYQQSPVLGAALQTGEWVSAASVFQGEQRCAPTSCADSQWDGDMPQLGATIIDRVFLNRAALHLAS